MTPSDLRITRAHELHGIGWGYKRIAKELGTSPTTVRRWITPGFAERSLLASRNAKRRRAGTCDQCGATTRYNGGTDPVSKLCADCGSRVGGQMRRDATLGKGPTQARILAFIGDGERRFTEIIDGCGLTAGFASSLLNRMLRYGILERPRRGVYRVVQP